MDNTVTPRMLDSEVRLRLQEERLRAMRERIGCWFPAFDELRLFLKSTAQLHRTHAKNLQKLYSAVKTDKFHAGTLRNSMKALAETGRIETQLNEAFGSWIERELIPQLEQLSGPIRQERVRLEESMQKFDKDRLNTMGNFNTAVLKHLSVCQAANMTTDPNTLLDDPFLSELQLQHAYEALRQRLESQQKTALGIQEQFTKYDTFFTSHIRDVLIKFVERRKIDTAKLQGHLQDHYNLSEGIDPMGDFDIFSKSTMFHNIGIWEPQLPVINVHENPPQFLGAVRSGVAEVKHSYLVASIWKKRLLVLTRAGRLHFFENLSEPEAVNVVSHNVIRSSVNFIPSDYVLSIVGANKNKLEIRLDQEDDVVSWLQELKGIGAFVPVQVMTLAERAQQQSSGDKNKPRRVVDFTSWVSSFLAFVPTTSSSAPLITDSNLPVVENYATVEDVKVSPVWQVTPEVVEKYRTMFATVDKDGDGIITENEVIRYIERSGINQSMVTNLWKMVTNGKPSPSVNFTQFSLAVHMAFYALKKNSLPSDLPNERRMYGLYVLENATTETGAASSSAASIASSATTPDEPMSMSSPVHEESDELDVQQQQQQQQQQPAYSLLDE